MTNYFELIRQWARDRNIIEGSTPQAQMVKTMEELGGIADFLFIDDLRVTDGIGDVAVCLTNLCAQYGFNAENYIHDTGITIRSDNMHKSLSLNKLTGALGCIAGRVARNDGNGVACVDCVGVAFFWLNTLAHSIGETLHSCMEFAYNEIKDRKGRMENGIFIKESEGV